MPRIVNYQNNSPEADTLAIDQIKGFLSPNQWDALQQGVGQVMCNHMTVKQFSFLFGLAGIQGYPFHAFCRKYLLKEYREWMHAGDKNEPAVMTDEQGFPIK